MVRGPAPIAHSITADRGAGHRGAVMLFSIATVPTARAACVRHSDEKDKRFGASIHAIEKELLRTENMLPPKRIQRQCLEP